MAKYPTARSAYIAWQQSVDLLTGERVIRDKRRYCRNCGALMEKRGALCVDCKSLVLEGLIRGR